MPVAEELGRKMGNSEGVLKIVVAAARAEAPTASRSTLCGIHIHENVHPTGSGMSSLSSHETFTRPAMYERAGGVCPNQTQSQQGRNLRPPHRAESGPGAQSSSSILRGLEEMESHISKDRA